MLVKVVNNGKHPLPEYKTREAAGMDLIANLEKPVVLRPMDRQLVMTGLHIQMPEGYEGQVRSRSGFALKEGVCVLNAPGTIDSDYRGEIGALLINLSRDEVVINDGDRIAQIVFNKHAKASLQLVDILDTSERSTGGFGSTGK